jgi:hypothetical protein
MLHQAKLHAWIVCRLAHEDEVRRAFLVTVVKLGAKRAKADSATP